MKNYKIISLFLFLILFLAANGQTRKELEQKKKETEAQIKLTQKILKETNSKKNKGLKEVTSLGILIEQREVLIETINKEILFVASDITSKLSEVDSVNAEIENQKLKYKKALVQNFKYKKIYNNSLYLFAAKSFNQFFQRIRFNKYLSKAQEQFLNKIKQEKLALEEKLKGLTILKSSKENLASGKKQEVVKLESDKQEKNKFVLALSGKEKELKIDLDKQKKAKQNLNAQINAIISKEIAEAKRRGAAEKAKNKTNIEKKTNIKTDNDGGKETDMLPEMKLLSDKFEINKGKLPWPVESGFISDRFGAHAHAKLDQVMIQNNGIDIRTTGGASARSIHKGTVSAIISIPGMGKAVLLNHGAYYTVYCKLKDIKVKQGEEVDAKQILGAIAEDEDGYTEMHFEIWYGQDKQNPEIWLLRK